MRKSKNLSLLRNLIYSLVLFGKIKTTKARAKAITGLVDRMVNKIKKGTVAGKRQVLTFLPQKLVVEKLVKEIIPKLTGRSSGYTRIIKIGERAGDGAPMVVMEWVESGKQPVAEPVEEGTKGKRRHAKTNKTS